MHLHFEEPSSQLRCDSVINSLSWMGRVPDEQPEVRRGGKTINKLLR